MPFLNLDNNWSNLASYYNNVASDGTFNSPGNVTSTRKPSPPPLLSQFIATDEGLIRGGFTNVRVALQKDFVRVGEFLFGNFKSRLNASQANPGAVLGLINRLFKTNLSQQNFSTKGLIFSTKQLGLHMSNPRVEDRLTGKENKYNNIGPTRIYNFGINTFASSISSVFGLHFDKPGLLPFLTSNQKYGGDLKDPQGIAWYNNFSDANKDKNTYFSIKSDDKDNTNTNRLVRLASKIYNAENKDKKRGIVLDDYPGGAQSIYGVGFTTIQTYDSTNKFSWIGVDGNIASQSINLTRFDNNGNQTTSGEEKLNYSTLREVLDFRHKQLREGNNIDYWTTSTISSNFSAKLDPTSTSTNAIGTIERDYGISRSKYGAYGIRTRRLDSINMLNIVTYEDFKKIKSNKTNKSLTWDLSSANIEDRLLYKDSDTEYSGNIGEDIIPFRIAFLDNNTFKKNTIFFRAYINDFQDGMNARWNPYRYMGRGDEFHIYEGFTRDISVDFTIFTHSPEEISPIYKKLNYLMSTFAPDYNIANKMRGNIAYLTIGEYLAFQPGIFTDIKLSGMLEGGWSTDHLLPKHIRVNLSFKPIHNFVARTMNINLRDGKIEPEDVRRGHPSFIGSPLNGFTSLNFDPNERVTDNNGNESKDFYHYIHDYGEQFNVRPVIVD